MESNLSRLIDLLPGLIWTALPDGRANFVNKRWLEYTGLTFEQACTGEGWLVAVHPDDRPDLLAGWLSFVESGEQGELEARLRRFDGEYRWFLFRASPIADETGDVVLWCGVNSDIEDRKRAEAAAQMQGQRLLETIDGLPALITLMDPAGRLEYANRYVLDYFGASLQELQRRPDADSFHPDDREGVLAEWAKSVDSGDPYDYSARQRRADGVYRWIRLRGFPLRDAERRIVQWYFLQTDIDDMKRAETLLAGEKRLLDMVAQGLPLPVVLEALCGIVEDAAPGCLCSILAIDPDGVRFRHCAGPSLPAAYSEVLDGLIMDGNYCPCGMAANLKIRVIADDVVVDPRWRTSPWPALVSGHGLRSCWSTPILSRDDRVIGVFALYKHQPGSPNPRELDLTRQFTQIASIAIERAQSDASLKLSEARKAAILDSALDCIVTMDHEGRITEFNPASERTFGHPRQAVIGELLADVIIPPALRDRHRRGLGSYLSGGGARILGKRIEMTALRAAGDEFPVELTVTRTPLDSPPSFTGYLRDISDRKQAEEALRRSNAYLAEAQRLSLTGSFSWNPVTDEHFWSDETYRIFEYDRATEASLGLILKKIHSEDRHLVDRVLAKACEGEDFEIEFRTVMASGAMKHVKVLAHRLRDREDSPEYLGAILDVTERRLSEQALRRSNAFLAETQRISSTGGFSWRVATSEIAWSEQVYRMFEYDPATPVTLDLIGARVHPEDRSLLEDMVASANRGVPDFEYEHRLLLPSGAIKHLHLMAHGNRDQAGQVEYIGAVQEVTERRVSEEALSRVRSELTHMARVTSLGAVTASIAHEVNQPLAGIITNANTCLKMLASDPPNVVGAQETARRTVRDGSRAADVIKRLRALFAKRDPTSEPVDLNEAAREVIALSGTDLQRSRVSLRLEFAADLPLIAGDRVQLQQVILNLLLNAADAMSDINDRPRQIVVKTEQKDADSVSLAVRDSGVGLDVQSAERLFEAFFTTKSEGMGMGLSISRSIIENHGGRLWAEPNNGPGVTFAFSVPRTSKGAAGADLVSQDATAHPQPPTVQS